VTPGSRVPGSDPVRGARELLTVALRTLQAIPSPPPDVRLSLDHIAAASSALYVAQTEARTEQAALAGLRTALDDLTRALDLLHARPSYLEGIETVAASVAQALALLYPRVRTSERQRRGVILPGAVPNDDQRALVALSDRLDAERREPAPQTERLPEARSGEQRVAGQRVTVEVDVGVLSESNFYAGIAADVSPGGVFVSTPQPLAVGTDMTLYFTLEGGRTLQADGVVRWTRPGDTNLPPGMGVAFTRLSPEDQRAIGDYCANRAPLVHD
jgi:uncharacterized protein (TIGR02266 family)